MPFDLTQSPRTQALQAGQQPAQDADEIFSQGFSQLAYDALNKANPELAGQVITFRVLETDAEQGSGVGTFIIAHNQDVYYVPVVLADNAIKPLDIFYSRRDDRYYPLAPEWLQAAGKNAVTELGKGVKPPKTLEGDVDIRGMVTPPMTGRFGYASADDPSIAFTSALKKTGHEARPLMLPTVLENAPNAVKVGFARVLKKHPALLKAATAYYGAARLTAALRPRAEKVAAAPAAPQADLYFATTATPVAELKRALGDKLAAEAYKTIRLKGFYAKDRRRSTDDLLEVSEQKLRLEEPTCPGIYTVYLTSGKAEKALVVPSPVCMRIRYGSDKGKKRVLVVLKDGRHALIEGEFVATRDVEATDKDLEAYVGAAGARPANGQVGALICLDGPRTRATEDVRVTGVTSAGDQTSFQGDWGTRVIISDKIGGSKYMKPQGDDLVVLSKNYRWTSLGERLVESDFHKNPMAILRTFESELQKTGAQRVEVRRAANAEFIVNRDGTPLSLERAAVKIARAHNVSLPAALNLCRRALEKKAAAAWAVKKATLTKRAAKEEAAAPSPEEEAAMQQQMAMQAPPQPSGLDLAVAEQMQMIQQQMAALQQQMQMLQTVQMRAQQVDMGGGAMAAPMGAASMMGGPPPGPGGMPAMAPMDPSMMGGQMGGQPMMGGQMDPSMMGQMGGQVGGQMDPSMMGQMGGQMDPSMMGGQGGQVDPATGQPMDPSMMGGQIDPATGQPMAPPPPPMPVMTEPLTADNVEAQINPEFLADAAALDQADVFDASAVASLAQSKGLSEQLLAYMPTLEKSLDNIGRVLLLFQLREPDLRQQIGNELFAETESNLRDVFRGMGETLHRINQAAQQVAVQPATQAQL